MRRMIYNNSPQSVGNGIQIQDQSSSRGAQKTTAGDGDLIPVTFVCDTSAYASGDLIADFATITNAVDIQGGRGILDSVTIVDEDAQGVKLYLIFATASTSLGTFNAAPNISDANARNIIGFVPVLTTDYITVSGTKVATVRNIGLMLEAASSTQDIYVGVLNDTGTPTFTASGLRAKFGIRQF